MTPTNPQPGRWLPVTATVAVVLCICLLVLAAGGGVVYILRGNASHLIDIPRRADATQTPEPGAKINRPSPDSVSKQAEASLEKTIIPDSDLYGLACRLRNT